MSVMPLLLASQAFAEVVEPMAYNSTEEYQRSDLGITILFSSFVLVLTVVTAGVIYLSVKNYSDNKQEKEDKERAGKPTPLGSKKVLGNFDTPDREDKVLSLRKEGRVKKEKGRGFGSMD